MIDTYESVMTLSPAGSSVIEFVAFSDPCIDMNSLLKVR